VGHMWWRKPLPGSCVSLVYTSWLRVGIAFVLCGAHVVVHTIA
jgi:hypothetical protein